MSHSNMAFFLNILADATATNSAPSGAAAGVAIPRDVRGEFAIARLRHTATGARTCTVKFWGYCAGEQDADGAAVASSAGWDDTEETMELGSTSTNGGFSKLFRLLAGYTRIYAEVTAIAGTSNTVNVALGLTANQGE